MKTSCVPVSFSQFNVEVTDSQGNQTGYTTDADALSYAVTGLTPDESYTFTVFAQAVTQNIDTGWSNPAVISAAASDGILSAAGPSIPEGGGSERR